MGNLINNQYLNTKHRRIKENEIANGICFICNAPIVYLIVHHIDGNHKNNKKENLIVCCKICHKIIHKGFTPLHKNLPKEVIDNLKQYRLIILQKKHTKRKAEELLEYELIMINQRGWYVNKDKCSVCDKKKNLQYFCHPLIKKYSPTPKKFSTPICKSCIKTLYN